ncbi:hypothetical protein [Lentilactobacillus sp. Marseille-Q4993]|uniref:hypothetical protein n=1 Tax=Lentilactobacillus sp. Marseille-Q4993 TaxID=3039492 RepID=UPI0024BC8B32|nr:hypothetical protein [Lentilactobacillus sp. Marseille-Q4993]
MLMLAMLMMVSGIFHFMLDNPANAAMFATWSLSYLVPVTFLNFFILIYGFISMAFGIYVDGKQSLLGTIWAIIALFGSP